MFSLQCNTKMFIIVLYVWSLLPLLSSKILIRHSIGTGEGNTSLFLKICSKKYMQCSSKNTYKLGKFELKEKIMFASRDTHVYLRAKIHVIYKFTLLSFFRTHP